MHSNKFSMFKSSKLYNCLSFQDQYTLTACAVLLEYLCDTVVAPLQRDMIEIDEPYCNSVRKDT